MVTLALPASCINSRSCASLEQATYTLFQICRACLTFNVTEIIIFDIPTEPVQNQPGQTKKVFLDTDTQKKTSVSCEAQLCATILQAFVTPVFMWKSVFSDTKLLMYARKLAKSFKMLDEDSSTALGLSVKKHTIKKKTKLSKRQKADARRTPFVNIGCQYVLELESEVECNRKVFVDLKTKKVVDKSQGYLVRCVKVFSEIFTDCTIEGGYTQACIVPCQQFYSKKLPTTATLSPSDLGKTSAPLIVFGRYAEVSASVQSDPELTASCDELFDGAICNFSSSRLEDAVSFVLAQTA